jgi:hypothetical protein
MTDAQQIFMRGVELHRENGTFNAAQQAKLDIAYEELKSGKVTLVRLFGLTQYLHTGWKEEYLAKKHPPEESCSDWRQNCRQVPECGCGECHRGMWAGVQKI